MITPNGGVFAGAMRADVGGDTSACEPAAALVEVPETGVPDPGGDETGPRTLS